MVGPYVLGISDIDVDTVRTHLLTAIAFACSTGAAAQIGRSWQLAPELTEPVAIVTVEIVWHDTAGELRQAVPDAHTKAMGHTVLVRDRESGAFRCTGHAVRVRGSPVDGDRTLNLGHEIAHCFGLVHR